MPEGPEIRVLGDQVRKAIVGKTITRVTAIADRPFTKILNYKKIIDGATIEAVDTFGKRMIWAFTNGYYIEFMFGMTGTFSMLMSDHNRIGFQLDNKQQIWYDDIRCFGKVSVKACPYMSAGIDPFGFSYTWLSFSKRLKNNNKRLAETLLEQGVIAGIGNYLRAEILYRCKLNPWRLCSSLEAPELHLLFAVIKQVMNESYKCGGCTLATYRHLDGGMGTFANHLQVYKKKTDPFGNKVVREVDKTNRAMWWVPAVQQ